VSFFNVIHEFLGKDKQLALRAQCGNMLCKRIFELKNPVFPLPEIVFCPPCTMRMNEGIQQWLHANTGKTKGNFHITEGYSRGD
jgi:hypothetical protein